MTLEERIKELEEENKYLNVQLDLAAKGSAIQYNKVRKLEKALDKVCLYLSINKPNKSYEEWKEYFLKEGE